MSLKKNRRLALSKAEGFTVLEIIIVLAIIGILASIVMGVIGKSREKAYYMRAQAEYKSMSEALEYYRDEFGDYPPDVNRNIPPGLEVYLAGEMEGYWPAAPWPGSVYDWDNWDDSDHPGEKIYQISIRFCPIGGPLNACKFPRETWAANFNINSSVYYCVSGRCRAHQSEPINYPGYCVNCATQPSG
jgi:prepilin-type N-terminal cleavage/methylation domain-containing protein